MSNYQEIPTFQDPFYSQVAELDGTAYVLNWQYNQREDCYYISVATQDGSDIVNGIKVVCDWPLLHWCADSRLPKGELICKRNTTVTDSVTVVVPTDPTQVIVRSTPGLGEIGDSQPYTLYYVPQDQLP